MELRAPADAWIDAARLLRIRQRSIDPPRRAFDPPARTMENDLSRQRKRKGEPVTGWLNLFKPVDMTSTQAVAILKRLYNAEKVGHGGTLDPLADGILPIALGEATKTVQWEEWPERVPTQSLPAPPAPTPSIASW